MAQNDKNHVFIHHMHLINLAFSSTMHSRQSSLLEELFFTLGQLILIPHSYIIDMPNLLLYMIMALKDANTRSYVSLLSTCHQCFLRFVNTHNKKYLSCQARAYFRWSSGFQRKDGDDKWVHIIVIQYKIYTIVWVTT